MNDTNTNKKNTIDSNLESFFDTFTDKFNPDSTLKECLEKRTKDLIITTYGLYSIIKSHYTNEKESAAIKRDLKDVAANKTINIISEYLPLMLELIGKDTIAYFKSLAKDKDKCITIEKPSPLLDSILMGQMLGLIYAKYDKKNNNVILHMPDEVKDTIINFLPTKKSKIYTQISEFFEALTFTYGVIDFDYAYELIDKSYDLPYNEVYMLIFINSYIGGMDFSFIPSTKLIHSIYIFEDEIAEELFKNADEIHYHSAKFIFDIRHGYYLRGLKEYTAFRKYLKDYYGFDISKDPIVIDELINTYIYFAQYDEELAKNHLDTTINNFFLIQDPSEKTTIIKYLDKIKDKMPSWKLGGAIKASTPSLAATRINDSKTKNIGRNDKCWCGSGLKFKNCHGK